MKKLAVFLALVFVVLCLIYPTDFTDESQMKILVLSCVIGGNFIIVLLRLSTS